MLLKDTVTHLESHVTWVQWTFLRAETSVIQKRSVIILYWTLASILRITEQSRTFPGCQDSEEIFELCHGIMIRKCIHQCTGLVQLVSTVLVSLDDDSLLSLCTAAKSVSITEIQIHGSGPGATFFSSFLVICLDNNNNDTGNLQSVTLWLKALNNTNTQKAKTSRLL